MILAFNLKLNEAQVNFLNHYQEYGFDSQEAMIQLALDKLKEELEDKDLEESAKLYAEIYQEESELQELTEAACADFPG